eukprot:465079-Karenia_brevis.AAC.1
MGFTAPTVIPAHPPVHMPGVMGMGEGVTGGPNGPPWVNATHAPPAHQALAGVQMLNSQNPHQPQP